jgi:hypothetical protein
LKALTPLLVESLERQGHLQLEEGVRTQLLAMSVSTMDRRLHTVRELTSGGRKKSTTTNRVRKMVAVRTFADWTEQLPGYLEVDLVTHCGQRAEGSFVHTLVLTDIVSGWTECVALPVGKIDGDHPRLDIRCSIRLSYAPMRAQIIVPAVEVIPNLGLQRL